MMGRTALLMIPTIVAMFAPMCTPDRRRGAQRESSRRENYGTVFNAEKATYQPGRNFTGGSFTVATPVPGAPSIGLRRGPINNWTNEVGNAAVIAMDPDTGKPKWKMTQFDVTDAGMLTTASDLLFTGEREGYLFALDARTGACCGKRVSARKS